LDNSDEEDIVSDGHTNASNFAGDTIMSKFLSSLPDSQTPAPLPENESMF